MPLATVSATALAGALLLSLILMGVSRKVLGAEVVSRRLVPHRGDIGVATFFNIGVAACVGLSLISSAWGPGGEMHYIPASLAQLGYLASIIARNDLPPAHPHRLLVLMAIWFGLATSTLILDVGAAASAQVLLEVMSLWVVKLRLNPSLHTQEGRSSAAAGDLERQSIGNGPNNKSKKQGTTSPAKPKPNKTATGKSKAGKRVKKR